MYQFDTVLPPRQQLISIHIQNNQLHRRIFLCQPSWNEGCLTYYAFIYLETDKMKHGMKPAVTHMVRRNPSSSSFDIPLGSCPSRAVELQPIIATGKTNPSQRVLQPAQEHNPYTGARVELNTLRSLLVVEDEPDIAMALQDLLEFEGFQVDCVSTCRQAFSSIEQNIYNAVLLDLELPDGDGCSILEKLQVSHPSLPVIILTASNRDLGPLRPYARLAKPWKRGELCGVLHRATGTALSQW